MTGWPPKGSECSGAYLVEALKGGWPPQSGRRKGLAQTEVRRWLIPWKRRATALAGLAPPLWRAIQSREVRTIFAQHEPEAD